ncbi:MAG TPA: phage tail protein [Reyranella sp.]|nr:phage tail protein [Reyranella sp.]
MPPVVGALVTAALTSTLGATLASVVGAVISAALSFVAQALLTPPASSAQRQKPERQPIDNKVTIRQPAGARPIVYGNTRVGGTYALIHSDQNNQNLYLVIMLAGHEIEAVDQIWFDDAILTFDGSGWVTGGTWVGRSPPGNDVTKFNNLARVTVHLGTPTQAADANFLSEIPSVWDATCRLQGIAYLAVKLVWNAETYSSGIPNITAVVRGKNDIYDPRTATTGYSSNPALCLVNYLCDPTYGVGVSYASGIDEPALIAAANACDLQVSGGGASGSGTEALFSADGASLSSDTPQVIIGNLLGAMHGKVAYDGNLWRVLAGAYQTPDNSFTDDDLRTSSRGPKIQTLTSRRDLFNCVKGTYIGADQNWQQGDFPPLISQPYITADGGLQVYKDITLAYCNSATRAQRIAQIDLLKARWQIVATMPCKLSAWQARAGDTVYWTSARYGWTNKPFEVSEAQLTIEHGKEGPQLGVDLTLLETDPSIYNPSSSILVLPPASAHTNLPDAINAGPPSNLSATEQLYVARDGGGVKNKVVLSWTASPDAFVTSGGGYLVQYQLQGASSWISLPVTSATSAEIPDVAPGTYNFQVASVNWAGNASTPITLAQAIVGLNAAPVTPQSFSVNAIGGAALCRWSLPTDLDVLQGGFMVIRFSGLTSGATWDQAVSIGEAVAANAMACVLPLKTGTYLAKFQNSNGVYSLSPASFVSSQTSMWAFTALGSLVENPAYAGVMTGVALDLDDGHLKLDSAQSFDSVSYVDGMASWDYPGGVGASGTYAFHAPLDLGSVQSCRLTSVLATQVYDVMDEFDTRPGDVDDWPTWDGTVTGEECDALLTVQTTQTNPSSSPTWSNAQRLDSAEFSARGFEFLLTLSSSDGNYNIGVSTLEAIAEAP